MEVERKRGRVHHEDDAQQHQRMPDDADHAVELGEQQSDAGGHGPSAGLESQPAIAPARDVR